MLLQKVWYDIEFEQIQREDEKLIEAIEKIISHAMLDVYKDAFYSSWGCSY